VRQERQLCSYKIIWFLNSIKVVLQACLPCLRLFSCLTKCKTIHSALHRKESYYIHISVEPILNYWHKSKYNWLPASLSVPPNIQTVRSTSVIQGNLYGWHKKQGCQDLLSLFLSRQLYQNFSTQCISYVRIPMTEAEKCMCHFSFQRNLYARTFPGNETHMSDKVWIKKPIPEFFRIKKLISLLFSSMP
jgi:hypothetical protein